MSKINEIIRGIIVGIVAVELAFVADILFEFTNSSKALVLKRFSKEQITLLRPDFRVKLLRYIEKNDTDSLAYLRNQIKKFESDKNILETMQVELLDIQNLIKNKDFKTALNLIITVKGEIKDISMFDTQEFSRQVDSLRVEMYNEAKK